MLLPQHQKTKIDDPCSERLDVAVEELGASSSTYADKE